MDDQFRLARFTEAQAPGYSSELADPLPGARRCACVALVTAAQERTAHLIFGYPDNLKLHSSLTLFAKRDPI